jgi:NTP pyrophosphatase (non-canonical NTP hydrolase)
LTIKDIHIKTIQNYGITDNINKAIQELNELIEELRDYKNNVGRNVNNIKEEIADVRNMLDKMILICKIDPSEVKSIQKDKMKRTLERLN